MSGVLRAGIEAAARKLCDAYGRRPDEIGSWGRPRWREKEDDAEIAIRAFLAVAEANGWRCVPVIATEEMRARGITGRLWCDVLDAAPRIEGEG